MEAMRPQQHTAFSSNINQDKFSERDMVPGSDLRNFSRDSCPSGMNHFKFMSSGFLAKERDKLSSQPAAPEAYMNQSLNNGPPINPITSN